MSKAGTDYSLTMVIIKFFLFEMREDKNIIKLKGKNTNR